MWKSLCIVLDLPQHRLVTWVIDDYSTMDVEATNDVYVRGGGVLVVGQRQAVEGKGFSVSHSLPGLLADLRLYGQALPEDAVGSFLSCKMSEAEVDVAPLVSFASLEETFVVSGTTLGSMAVEDACSQEEIQVVVLADLMPFSEARRLCELMGGKVALPNTTEEQVALLSALQPYSNTCENGVSLGNVWVDEERRSEGGFHGFLSEVKANGDSCTALTVWGEAAGRWHHTDCKDLKCAACILLRPSYWLLRGHDLALDHEYYLESGSLTGLTGFFSSIITLQQNDSDSPGQWLLTNSWHPQIGAILPRTSHTHYPFGLQEWQLLTPPTDSSSTKARLLLTPCVGNQLTCRSGHCINRDYRCDNEIDCQDGSEEENCARVRLPNGYRRQVSPPRKVGSGPRRLVVQAEVLAVTEFDVTGFVVTTEMKLYFMWHDARLHFLNLQYDQWKNELSNSLIWEPDVHLVASNGAACKVTHHYKSLTARQHNTPLDDDVRQTSEGE